MQITPDLILNAYCQGYFPMADGPGGEIGWYSPDPRAVQPFVEGDPLGEFRVRRSLAKRVRNGGFTVTINQRFADVIRGCAQPRSEANGVWISDQIKALYTRLHEMGFAHSIEAWRGDELVGGLYGVAIGAAFFGESMFSREPDASQVCYVHLIEYLRKHGYQLLDVQFVNPHLEQFGVVEIPQSMYHSLLEAALSQDIR